MASTLSLDVRYIFLVGSRMFLSMVVQQLAVILVLWLEKVNTSPSTSLLYSDSNLYSLWSSSFHLFHGDATSTLVLCY